METTKHFINFNNEQQWKEGLKHALTTGFPVVEMCEDAYEHFLGCVPPKAHKGSAFMNSEPEHHNSRGQEVCIAGLERSGKYYAQYGTLNDFKTGAMFKALPN